MDHFAQFAGGQPYMVATDPQASQPEKKCASADVADLQKPGGRRRGVCGTYADCAGMVGRAVGHLTFFLNDPFSGPGYLTTPYPEHSAAT